MCDTTHMADSRMITFTVLANQLTLAPRGDVPVFFTSDTPCVQCTNCNMVWVNTEGQVNDPTYGHVCDMSPHTPGAAWTNWGAGIIDPGPDINH